MTTTKKKYRERLINREKQWPVCRTNRLVRLELVARGKGENYFGSQQRGSTVGNKRTPLAYDDLFKDRGKTDQPVRTILVEGDAGIGKTTFCTSLSEDWANGKLLTQFELLLLLPLRHKSIASASSFSDLLHLWCSNQDLHASIASHIDKNEGEGVLVIADGWDELDESKRQEGSFMYNFLFRELFPFLSVLLTSRPTFSPSLHLVPYHSVQFVEIHGFNEENVKEYIQSEFAVNGEMAERLLHQLENNPLVESVCSIPLNCAIICHLWHTLNEVLPTSMTELYTKIILNIILRNLQKYGLYKSIRSISSFDSIPEGLQDAWWCLCQFAFDTIKRGQIIFAEKDLQDFFPQGSTVVSNILSFGLLQIAESYFDTGREVSFHYLHLTIQEYLAALYLARQPPSRQLEVLNALHFVKTNLDSQLEYFLCLSDSSGASNVAKSRKFAIVWRFFFGLYFNLYFKEKKDHELLDIKQAIEAFDPHTDALVLCHCAFEAKNNSVSNQIIQRLTKLSNLFSISLTKSIIPRTAHDCAAMIYVIDNIQECSNMEITFFNCHIRDAQIKALTDVLVRKQGMLQITKLDLRFNKLTDKGIGDLFNRSSTAFQSLQHVHLLSNRIGGEGIKYVTTVLANNGLSQLGLSHNPLGVSGMRELRNAIHGGKLANLRQLDIIRTLTSDAELNGELLATLMEAVLAHCPCLNNLDVSDNNLGVPGATVLGRSLSQLTQSKTGSILCMNEAKLGDEGLIAFVNNLQGPCHLDELQLKKNHIHGTGIQYLADSMCSQKIRMEGNLSQFFLDDNPLGLDGTLEVAKMLSMCDISQAIELKGCQLAISTVAVKTHTAKDIGQQLCSMSQRMHSPIGILHLSANGFTGEGIHILAGFMHLCPFLQCLKCDYCGITSNDFKQLLALLTDLKVSSPEICSCLREWNLENNEIGDSGVTALIEHLPNLFPELTKIQLNNNPVSDEVLEWLQGEQKKREKV